MLRDKTLEFKVGVFVLGAILALGVLLFNMGEFRVQSGYQIRVLFGYTAGLEVGAPVQVAGVPVGEVERIQFYQGEDNASRVEVIASIREGVTIDRTAEVHIATQSLLGTKYLEILPRSSKNQIVVGPSDWIIGQDPIMMEEMAQTGSRVARKLEKTVDSVNAWVSLRLPNR